MLFPLHTSIHRSGARSCAATQWGTSCSYDEPLHEHSFSLWDHEARYIVGGAAADVGTDRGHDLYTVAGAHDLTTTC